MTGTELKKIREGLFLSKSNLAKAAQLSAACITRWEREDTLGGGFPVMAQGYIKSVLLRLAQERYLSCLAVYDELSAEYENLLQEEGGQL